nr:PREDICTED: tumor necrosis factor isoform X2 [Latimeria chalumnae]|eukprot:XP_014350753.1 PREDICTED: tumor necrosis factor isoform X2 [Latimeria chalumnae]
MSTENMLCEFDKKGLIVLREEKRSSTAWRWISLLSFLLLIGAMALFAAMHFQQKPSTSTQTQNPEKSEQDQMPRITSESIIENQKLVWHSDINHAFLKDGMKLENNKLVVPSRGLYFIYSQVVFKGQGCNGPRSLSHAIYRYSQQYPVDKVLLSSSKTVCEGNTHHDKPWLQPIYQGAVFDLEKDDVLSTETHPESNGDIDTEDGNTYFGAFAL